MATLSGEEGDWEHLNQTNWRGLGLTDPIKSVEVRSFFLKSISFYQ
jgi:DNA-directed RNA polymerase III subunit RPC2